MSRGLAASLAAAATFALGVAAAAADTPAGAACPASNPPDTLTLVGGTPQTAPLHQAFAEMFQVALANTNGCPVTTAEAGTAVTFTAPSSGASGTFSASGSNTVTVGTDATGEATAPSFVAGSSAGTYVVAASSACGSVSFSLTNSAGGVAATITADAPTTESATAGSEYPQPLRATVLDAAGNPVAGASVTFVLGSGGAGAGGAGAGGANEAAAATFDGGGTQATELTDASGTATSPLVAANGTAGRFVATAATAGIAEPARFTLENVAGKPPTIAALAPTRQSARVGVPYGRPLEVRVRDGSGKPLQGAGVTFTLGSSAAPGGGAGAIATPAASFVDGSSQATEATNAAGIAASPRFTANAAPGRFTATATTTGTNAAASFSLDNLAGKPSTIVAVGTARGSATVGARYAKPMQAKVRDGSGKPVPGATVTFTLGAAAGEGGGTGSTRAAGASFAGGSSQATETTNAAGIATSPHLTANGTAGTFTATAAATGAASDASFALSNLPGKPATLTAGAAATESTPVGTRFPIRLAVAVADSDDNPVAGVAVTFSAPHGGPTGRFDGRTRFSVTVKTDVRGIAVAPAFVANDVPGGYAVRARAGGRSVGFALVNQPAL